MTKDQIEFLKELMNLRIEQENDDDLKYDVLTYGDGYKRYFRLDAADRIEAEQYQQLKVLVDRLLWAFREELGNE